MPLPIQPHPEGMPRIAVIGMGYVGAVTGVEIDPVKLERLQAGRSPVSEPGLDDALHQATESGRFTASDNLAQAVANAEIVMVCVGTPSSEDGKADLQAIDRVTDELAQTLAGREQPCVVMIRSTVPPGTTRARIAPVIQQANPQVAVCHHPEFCVKAPPWRTGPPRR
jgi:GDP-mannose 6-dehydrogenase